MMSQAANSRNGIRGMCSCVKVPPESGFQDTCTRPRLHDVVSLGGSELKFPPAASQTQGEANVGESSLDPTTPRNYYKCNYSPF